MTCQTDLLASGDDEVRSFPPHLDPARASLVLVFEEQDRDHVAAPVDGVLPIGAVGNNRPVHVVRVFDRHEATLHAESFPTDRAAQRYAETIRGALDRNRQAVLFG